MSCNNNFTKDADLSIRVRNLNKCYQLYENPRDRLKQFILPKLRRVMRRPHTQYFIEFCPLNNISFDVKKGEALGIIGKNGAGKSTLLQTVCGTLTPTSGTVETFGRVAALLELGAGFNPEFTGRENVYLNASILGLTPQEIEASFEEIVAFADIGLFIDQPVKTYSSGMFVRLAFSIATSVKPDILVIDEALSVGDGEFSRKSFDRIMDLKRQGTTILFCSHALYQTEMFCDRVLWLDHGRCVMLGQPGDVVPRYSSALLGAGIPQTAISNETITGESSKPLTATTEITPDTHFPDKQARFVSVQTTMDGITAKKLTGRCGESELNIQMEFICDPNLPPPTVGLTLDYGSLLAVTCVSSRTEQIPIEWMGRGHGRASITFPKLPLRKGNYLIGTYLCCENAIHFYDILIGAAEIEMEDSSSEPGLVTMPHYWHTTTPIPDSLPLVTVHGHYRMAIDKHDSLCLLRNNGLFETEEVALCRLLIARGDHVLDIGANIGYYTLLFAGLVGETGSVSAIEPDAENYRLLRENLALNSLAGIIQTHQVALGGQTGTAKLYQSDNNNGMHRLYASVCCTDQATETPVITGDSLNLAPLDFIKIDIEGYEPAALQGLSSTLKKSPNLKILSEFSPLSIWEAGFSPITFLDSMQQHGFYLFCHESGCWCRQSYETFHVELNKISPTVISAFLLELKSEKNIQTIVQYAADFLKKQGYSRPVLENVLFVAPSAMNQVTTIINDLSQTSQHH